MISIVAGRVTLLSFVLLSNACAPISTTGRPATVFGTVSVDAVPINNSDEDRIKFYVTSHPALLDGFITAYRRYVKEFKEQLDKEDRTLMKSIFPAPLLRFHCR